MLQVKFQRKSFALCIKRANIENSQVNKLCDFKGFGKKAQPKFRAAICTLTMAKFEKSSANCIKPEVCL